MDTGLTGQQQRDILVFLQVANNPSPLQVSADSTGKAAAGAALPGKQVYQQTCMACHGADGTDAMPGTPGSPMAMPAMGGNLTLTAADVRSVLGYLRETFGPR